VKVLVTGATGLIGAHIVRALVAAGNNVTAMVRPTSQRAPIADLPIRWFVADLLDDNARLEEACKGCDAVFHTAAQFSYHAAAETYGTAVRGTASILRACARERVDRVIVTSSSVVFGSGDASANIDEQADLTPPAGEPAYVAAKIAQHRQSVALGKRLKLDVRLACPTMTLGPTSAQLGPSNGIVLAYLTDPFGCTYPGGCNLVSARDVAAGHLAIAQHGEAGESYLLGSQNLTWNDIHNTIAELSGLPPPRIVLNHSLSFLAAAVEEMRATIAGRAALSTREQAAMVGRYYWYSHAKAAQLGYAPAPAHDALVETISWLAASPHVTRETRARMHLADEIHHFRYGFAR
jgi:dihydroflavonol-4-reductase